MNQLLVNLGHPLADVAETELEALIGPYDTCVVRVQLDLEAPLAEQVTAAIDAAGISSETWQTRGIVLNLPGVSLAAAIAVTEIAGRTGTQPRVIQLSRAEDGVFHVAEIVDLMKVRGAARAAR